MLIFTKVMLLSTSRSGSRTVFEKVLIRSWRSRWQLVSNGR